MAPREYPHSYVIPPTSHQQCRRGGKLFIDLLGGAGDHPHTALAIASEVGRVISGDDLRRMWLELPLTIIQILAAGLGASGGRARVATANFRVLA